jgi:hypothetical protein
VQAVAHHCPALKRLFLRFCPLVREASIQQIVQRCSKIVEVTPSSAFNRLLWEHCVHNPARCSALHLNVACDRCETLLFSLEPQNAEVGLGSQPHLSNEVYTNEAPTDMESMVDVSDVFGSSTATMYNCPNNCHCTPTQQLWLVDHGSGLINIKGFSFAMACGNDFAKMAWVDVADCTKKRHVGNLSASVAFYRKQDMERRKSTRPSSRFYQNLKGACTPQHSEDGYDFTTAMQCLTSSHFTGCADDYLDGEGSTLFMTAVPPVFESHAMSWGAILEILQNFGADASHENEKGSTAGMWCMNLWPELMQPDSRNGIRLRIMQMLGIDGHLESGEAEWPML